MQPNNESLDFLRGEKLVKSFPTPQPKKPVATIGQLYEIPNDIFAECKKEADRLHGLHPNWDSSRLARKVAEKFKLKIRKESE